MAKKKRLEKLTTAQEEFCRIYTSKDNPKAYLNGTQAYLASHPESSPATAGVEASRSLDLPKINNRISELLNKDGITLSRLNGVGNKLLQSQSEDIQLRSAKMYYELHDAFPKNMTNNNTGDKITIEIRQVIPQVVINKQDASI